MIHWMFTFCKTGPECYFPSLFIFSSILKTTSSTVVNNNTVNTLALYSDILHCCALYNAVYETQSVCEWCGQKRFGPDVVICSSDSEALDYSPLVSSVIPANLGFSFTLHCGHSLTLTRTRTMEIQRVCVSTGLV